MQLRDAASGGPRRTITDTTGPVSDIAFSPQRHLLATVRADGLVRGWGAATGKLRRTLTDTTSPVHAVAFSPDGRTLATAGSQGVVRLWDTQTGKSRSTPTGHRDEVEAIAFAPDGRTLATGVSDGTVRLWDSALTTPTRSIRKLCRGVHRDLTPQERWVYLPDLPSSPPCPT
ncbi:WD40 repeat domain-containing protein [Streptomyces sp. RK9]|uniref:WD40 repeat domain-containing protein n=1 Tax=Streptomyces sp. RK9 TaxID=3239284 RepID=UPI003865649C